jgi:hypothetical protein
MTSELARKFELVRKLVTSELIKIAEQSNGRLMPEVLLLVCARNGAANVTNASSGGRNHTRRGFI